MARFKIKAHVLSFSLLFGVGTVGAFAVSYLFGKSDSEKREILDAKIRSDPELLKRQIERKAAMQDFFNKIKDGDKDKDLQKKFDEVLKGGRSDNKRHEHELNLKLAAKPAESNNVTLKAANKTDLPPQAQQEAKNTEASKPKGWFW